MNNSHGDTASSHTLKDAKSSQENEKLLINQFQMRLKHLRKEYPERAEAGNQLRGIINQIRNQTSKTKKDTFDEFLQERHQK